MGDKVLGKEMTRLREGCAKTSGETAVNPCRGRCHAEREIKRVGSSNGVGRELFKTVSCGGFFGGGGFILDSRLELKNRVVAHKGLT